MTTALDHVRPVATPGRIGQATTVEQSRAIAEVQAAVVVAQQMPRNVDRAVREMLRSCSRKGLAEKAFYRFPRGGQQVSGESVVLAKELARCWGNIQYGIVELSRDDVAGESEMKAFAWDLETNAQPSTTFIVPHIRDTTSGGTRLTGARDIYENNANMGARRQREMIFNILPPWFIEDAKAACYATLAADDSDGATLAERAATAVGRFGKIGVKPAQLVQKLGAPQDKWSAADLAQLGVIYRSVERGETTKEDEFGATAPAVTAADITGQPKADKPARQRGKPAASQNVPPAPAAAPEAARSPSGAGGTSAGGGERPPALASSGQADMIGRRAEKFGYSPAPDDQEAWLRVVARLAGTGELADVKRLTQDQAKQVIRQLDACKDAAALEDLLNDGVMVAEEAARDE